MPAKKDSSGSTKQEEYQRTEKYDSYQNDLPEVRQLDEAVPPKSFGDSSLEPNTGLTNSYDFALFGLALHELLDRLRLSIIVNAFLCFVAMFITWWMHANPIKLVFSIILGAMVLLLLIVELSSFFRSAGRNSASTSTGSNNNAGEDGEGGENKAMKILKKCEEIGLLMLYHPIGKTVYLLVCGLLCWMIGGLYLLLLGLLFLANAGVLLYCWLTYPEFRRTFENSNDEEEGDNDGPASSAAWSHYYKSSKKTVSEISEKVGEKASLLGTAFGRKK